MRKLIVGVIAVFSACGGQNGFDGGATDAGPVDSGTMDGGTPDAGPPALVRITGAVQKGPFILGSPVVLSAIDDEANPTGQNFVTQTSDSLGNFELNAQYQGSIAASATGYYYNEVSGRLSDSPIELRAHLVVSAVSAQQNYINIVTHLTSDRVKVLVRSPYSMTMTAAIDQAESELRATLGVGGPSFNPNAEGSQMSVTGGDSDANAYLFALSAIFAEIAVARTPGGAMDGGGVSSDATLQELLNTTAHDFALVGQVSASLQQDIGHAQQSNDPHVLMALLEQRISMLGSSAAVPDLDRVWDNDGDGLPNAADNCPDIANPGQEPLDGTAGYHDGGDGACVANGACSAGFHDGGDGHCVVTGVCSAGFHLGGGQACAPDGSCSTGYLICGGPCQPVFDPAVRQYGGIDVQMIAVGDFDSDGQTDLAMSVANVSAVDILWGVGGSSVQKSRVAISNTPNSLVSGDFNADGLLDLAGTYSTGVFVLWNGSLLRDAGVSGASYADLSPGGLVNRVASADIDGDDAGDLVVSLHHDGTHVLLNQRDGGFLDSQTLARATEGQLFGGVAAVGHWDSDPYLDLIIAYSMESASLPAGFDVYLGDSSGHFSLRQSNLINDVVYDLHIGDLNNDGVNDVVAQTFNTGANVWLGLGDGTVAAPLSISQGGVVTDVDGDGLSDLVSTDADDLLVGFGRPGDAGISPVRYSMLQADAGNTALPGFVGSLIVTDINQDGQIDVAMRYPSAKDYVRVVFGTDCP